MGRTPKPGDLPVRPLSDTVPAWAKSRLGSDAINAAQLAVGGGAAFKAAKVARDVVVGRTAQKAGESAVNIIKSQQGNVKLPDAAGKNKTIFTDSSKPTTATNMVGKKIVTTSPTKVNLTTKPLSSNKVEGSVKGQITKLNNDAEKAGNLTRQSSEAPIKNTVTKAGAAIAAAGTVGYLAGKSDGAKSVTVSQPTQNSNPVRTAGNSAPKIHPDNNPLKR
jgi:hypothetical protein